MTTRSEEHEIALDKSEEKSDRLLASAEVHLHEAWARSSGDPRRLQQLRDAMSNLEAAIEIEKAWRLLRLF